MIPPRDWVETPVALTHHIYTPTAIEETIRAFHDLCAVESNVEGESTHLFISVKSGSPITVCNDFLNYALELSAQELLRREE